jgi:hypothetical protein
MSTHPNAGPLKCSAAIPKANLRGLSAGVRTLDRLGATVCLQEVELGGSTVEVGDGIELDIRLPQNKSFEPRTLSAIGSAIRVSDGVPGRLWLVIRFHSLQFRGATAERPGETAASPRGGKAREVELAGEDWAEVPPPPRKM